MHSFELSWLRSITIVGHDWSDLAAVALVPAAWFPGCAVGVLSQVCCVSLLGHWSLAATLLMDVNHSGSQEDLVSNWEPHSLVGDAVSGAKLALSFQLWLSPTCLPASGGGWASLQPADSPLVLAQSFVLWVGPAVPYLRLELFMGKFSLSLLFLIFFFSSLAIPQFGLLSHVSSLRLPSGHSGPVLTISNEAHTSLFSPCLLVADTSVWAISPLGVSVKCIICGFYLFIFSSWLCCPLRFQNSPQTRWWEGFLMFGNF